MPISRRSFIGRTLLWIVGILNVGGIASVVLKFLYPGRRGRDRQIYVSQLSDIAVGASRLYTLPSGQETLIVRSHDRIRAFSTRCTHLGCKVFWRPELKQFHCPCHQGFFDENGNVISGPPPEPLDTYEMVVQDSNIYITYREIPS